MTSGPYVKLPPSVSEKLLLTWEKSVISEDMYYECRYAGETHRVEILWRLQPAGWIFHVSLQKEDLPIGMGQRNFARKENVDLEFPGPGIKDDDWLLASLLWAEDQLLSPMARLARTVS